MILDRLYIAYTRRIITTEIIVIFYQGIGIMATLTISTRPKKCVTPHAYKIDYIAFNVSGFSPDT